MGCERRHDKSIITENFVLTFWFKTHTRQTLCPSRPRLSSSATAAKRRALVTACYDGYYPQVMETKLTEVVLRGGRRADALCIQPPAPEWRNRIAPFLAHKGQPWNWHIRTNLDGNNDDLEQRFFIVVANGQVISELMVVEKHGVAILGHVFTDLDWRNQGCTSSLLEAMTEDFAARDGIAMHLGTDFDSQAFRIYGRFGFKPMWPGSGRMEWIRDQERFDALFAPGSPGDIRVEAACWTHWPLLHKLMLGKEGDWLRNAALSLAGQADAEDAHVRLMSWLYSGPPNAAAVLINQTGMTVGLATLTARQSLPSRMLQLDVYVHPTARDQLGALIDAIKLPNDRPVMAQIDSESPKRHQALIDAGFTDVGRIKDALNADGTDMDLVLMQT